MTTFREAIADTIGDTWYDHTRFPEGKYIENVSEADAVLAMPEMQALRRAVALFASIRAFEQYGVSMVDELRRASLPEDVIDWICAPADRLQRQEETQ